MSEDAVEDSHCEPIWGFEGDQGRSVPGVYVQPAEIDREAIFIEVVYGLTCLAKAFGHSQEAAGVEAAVRYVQQMIDWEV